MAVAEYSFSDLLRNPTRVVEELAGGDVLLRRRGDEPLRLSLWKRDEATGETLRAVVRLLRTLAVHSPDALAAAAGEAFPWTDFLPQADRATFLAELTRVLVAGADIGAFAPVVRTLEEWRATAAIHADPEMALRLAAPLAGHGDPVPPPP